MRRRDAATSREEEPEEEFQRVWERPHLRQNAQKKWEEGG
jgi:hypothetical protein